MRFCGTFCAREQLARPEERAEPHADARERVGAALLPVDHTDSVPDVEAGTAQSFDRLRERTAGGDDVLHQAHEVPRLERALDAVRGSIVLRLTANDDEG